jgi:hypothetical protein
MIFNEIIIYFNKLRLSDLFLYPYIYIHLFILLKIIFEYNIINTLEF